MTAKNRAMKLLDWIKKLMRIVSTYDSDLIRAHDRINEVEKFVRARTTIAVDVGYGSRDNHVIVIGRYRDADYVQTFSMASQDMAHLIRQLQSMERYGEVKFVDAPREFSAVIKRGLKEL